VARKHAPELQPPHAFAPSQVGMQDVLLDRRRVYKILQVRATGCSSSVSRFGAG
jgi:hypothetical protein